MKFEKSHVNVLYILLGITKYETIVWIRHWRVLLSSTIYSDYVTSFHVIVFVDICIVHRFM